MISLLWKSKKKSFVCEFKLHVAFNLNSISQWKLMALCVKVIEWLGPLISMKPIIPNNNCHWKLFSFMKSFSLQYVNTLCILNPILYICLVLAICCLCFWFSYRYGSIRKLYFPMYIMARLVLFWTFGRWKWHVINISKAWFLELLWNK